MCMGSYIDLIPIMFTVWVHGCDSKQTVEERDMRVLIDNQLKFMTIHLYTWLLVKQGGFNFGVDK